VTLTGVVALGVVAGSAVLLAAFFAIERRSPAALVWLAVLARLAVKWVYHPARLLAGTNGLDLPRNGQGIALIGDPRDDVHVFAAHLHQVPLSGRWGTRRTS
jgi:hypothetical protein